MAASVRSAAIHASRAIPVGHRTVFRLGATYRTHEYSYGPVVRASDAVPLPQAERRRLDGVSVTSAFVQDRPVTFENFAAIGRTEDYNLG